MIFKTECTHVVSQNNTHFPDMVFCVNGTQPEKKNHQKKFLSFRNDVFCHS